MRHTLPIAATLFAFSLVMVAGEAWALSREPYLAFAGHQNLISLTSYLYGLGYIVIAMSQFYRVWRSKAVSPSPIGMKKSACCLLAGGFLLMGFPFVQIRVLPIVQKTDFSVVQTTVLPGSIFYSWILILFFVSLPWCVLFRLKDFKAHGGILKDWLISALWRPPLTLIAILMFFWICRLVVHLFSLAWSKL